MRRIRYLLLLTLVWCLLVVPPEASGQSEYLDVNVSRSYRMYAVEEGILDQEVIGTRTWWIGLRNYEPATLSGSELEIRTIHRPDLIRFYPLPTGTAQQGEHYVLRWKFDQTPSRGQNGVSVFFSEYESFRLKANITRFVNPTIVTSQKTRLTCETKIVSSSDLEGVSVDVRFPQTEEVAAVLTGLQPSPSTQEPSRASWWISPVGRGIPFTVKVELDILNKIFPSSVMYKPYVYMKPIDRSPKRGRAAGDWLSVQDDILGAVTWRVDGVHSWAWRHEEGRETIFESVCSWPAGELPSGNMLQTGKSRCFGIESVREASDALTRTVAHELSQTEARKPLRSIGDEWLPVPSESLRKWLAVLSRRLVSVSLRQLSFQLAEFETHNPREDIGP